MNEKTVSLVSEDVRRHNVHLVLEHIIRSSKPARSEVADATGLTRGTITALVSRLLKAGIVRETKSPRERGIGRPLTGLEIAGDHICVLAAQIDADSTTAVLASISGEILARFSAPHGRPMGKPEIVLDLLALEIVDALNCARELGRRVVDVTVIAFAPVAGEPAIVLADTDLDWGPTDVVAELRARVAAIDDLARHRADAVSLVGDTPLAATAEHDASELGGAMLYIKSDSGIGGALVTADGNALTGEHGFGGAFGHLAVDYTGARCLCGQRGCLVTVAGPDVLLDRVGLSDVAGRDGLSLALEKFVDRILDGDPVAVRVWAEAEEWIARTLSILALAFDPASIVIGGYWAQFSNGIAERIGNSRPTRNSLDVLPPLPVRPGVFGADAALRGALDAARERIFRDPFAYA